MSIDSQAKRMSALGEGMVLPDTEVDAHDMRTVAWQYYHTLVPTGLDSILPPVARVPKAREIDARLRRFCDGLAGPGVSESGTTQVVNNRLEVYFTETDTEPDDPPHGKGVVWMSSGVGPGDQGDIMAKVTMGTTTRTGTIFNFSSPSPNRFPWPIF